MKISECLVIVRGGGDLATGTIHCLFSCGFKVLVLETGQPTTIRRLAAFSEVMYQNDIEVEGIKARRIVSQKDIEDCFASGILPVAKDPEGVWIKRLRPQVVVDGIIAKKIWEPKLTWPRLSLGWDLAFARARMSMLLSKQCAAIGWAVYCARGVRFQIQACRE